jgi:hypothetical protein
VARFYVAFTTPTLQDVITEMFRHIDIQGIDANTLPDAFWYRTSSEKIKTRFKLNDDSDWLRLKDEYARTFKKKKDDAKAFIYLPDDVSLLYTFLFFFFTDVLQFMRRLQGAHINLKNGRTAAGTRKAAGGAEDPDVKARDAFKDNAVGLTEELKEQGDELKAILKKCQRHATPDGQNLCHVDKHSRHYVVNWSQCRLWLDRLVSVV